MDCRRVCLPPHRDIALHKARTQAYKHHRREVPTVTLIAKHSPPNIPDHYYIGLKVNAPANSATPPHTHGGGAVAATMIRGRMVNQMICPHHEPDSQGTGVEILGAGESWYEPPGCHHVRSENPFDEEAEFMTWFVVSKEYVDREGIAGLVVLDAAVEEREAKR